jgi:hypothetical protein
VHHDLSAAGGVADRLMPGGWPEELNSALFQLLAQNIRTPQVWIDSFDYLIPHLLVRLAGWPQGRDLRIESFESGPTLCSGSGLDPAPVRVYREQGNYYVVDFGHPVLVGSGGNSFFRALLFSMGQAQVVLVDGLPLGSDRSEPAVIAALRDQLAQYIVHHPEEVGRLLYAWQPPAPSPP